MQSQDALNYCATASKTFSGSLIVAELFTSAETASSASTRSEEMCRRGDVRGAAAARCGAATPGRAGLGGRVRASGVAACSHTDSGATFPLRLLRTAIP